MSKCSSMLRSRYLTDFYCGFCGVWLKHGKAVYSEDSCPRCPDCNCKVRTDPRSVPEEQRKYVQIEEAS